MGVFRKQSWAYRPLNLALIVALVVQLALLSTSAQTATADLQITSVDRSAIFTNPQTSMATGNLRATIYNAGALNITTPFTVTAFVDGDRNGLLGSTTADTVLGNARVTSLAGAQSSPVTIPLNGDLGFLDNRIAVMVDSKKTVPESSENNNLSVKAVACADLPPALALTPRIKWSWPLGTTSESGSKHVVMTPAVADLNLDRVPELVFSSFKTDPQADGRLRAVKGSDGTELWSVADAALAVNARAGVAVGNLDGDPNPEIVAVAQRSNTLLAFEHDGTLKWRSATATKLWAQTGGGAPAIANLDQSGAPEIIYGAAVFNSDGTLRWEREYGQGSPAHTGPLAIPVNLDNTGPLEIVAGNTAYRADGTVYWKDSTLPDGFTAIGNLDTDLNPEIVLVGGGRVHVLNHNGTQRWQNTRVITGTELGGPPVIADLDNDGTPEIGVSGALTYTMLKADNNARWSRTISDTSAMAGGTVFDFQGDGYPEVVFRDEKTLRILSWDGKLAWSTPLSSSTWQELPIVADLEGDGDAELVVVADSFLHGGNSGLRVYEDTNGQWMGARPLWNQHSYHVTNVDDGAAIPTQEAASWLANNSYRANSAIVAGTRPQPMADLTASRLTVSPVTGGYALWARIGNGGTLAAGAGVKVSFYQGLPESADRALISTLVLTRGLGIDQYQDVGLKWTTALKPEQSLPVYVAVDEGAGVAECSEANNVVVRVQPAVTSASASSCALSSYGQITCWGDSSYYNIGTYQTARFRIFKQISEGTNGAPCGISSNDFALCWGINGTGEQRWAGEQRHIAVGARATCAIRLDKTITLDKTIMCWGNNGSDPGYNLLNGPAGTFSAISVGDTHACGVKTDGSVTCWGADDYGQYIIAPAGTYVSIDAGFRVTCALTAATATTPQGQIYCEGDPASPIMRKPRPSGAFSQLSLGDKFGCGVRTSDRAIVCWGDMGTTPASQTGPFKQVSVGVSHYCAVTTSDKIQCWGSNGSGQTNVPPELQ